MFCEAHRSIQCTQFGVRERLDIGIFLHENEAIFEAFLSHLWESVGVEKGTGKWEGCSGCSGRKLQSNQCIAGGYWLFCSGLESRAKQRQNFLNYISDTMKEEKLILFIYFVFVF